MRTNKTLPALKKRYTYEEVVNAIQKAEGVRTTICKVLDCSQTQLRNYLEEHPELKQVMLDARENILDFAERVVWANMIQTKDPYLQQRAAEFTLRCIGRHRGWGQDGFQGMQVNVDQSDKDLKVSIQGIFGI